MIDCIRSEFIPDAIKIANCIEQAGGNVINITMGRENIDWVVFYRCLGEAQRAQISQEVYALLDKEKRWHSVLVVIIKGYNMSLQELLSEVQSKADERIYEVFAGLSAKWIGKSP